MKRILTITTILLMTITLTGCGCNKKEENSKVNNNQEQTVIDDQIYEGLEFVNVGTSNGVIKTVVINNTGVVYEGSKFSMKIMDESGNILVELTDEVKKEMANGTTQTIETKTKADLSKAVSIEYSIVK